VFGDTYCPAHVIYVRNAILSAFWGEAEIQVVANMGPPTDLPNIWPPTGLTGFVMDGPGKAFVVGFTKLIAISFTVAGGLRGGKYQLDADATYTSSMYHLPQLLLSFLTCVLVYP
jgi:hypothetical protein